MLDALRRQPVLPTRPSVHGYELLSRADAGQQPREVRDNTATTSVIVSGILELRAALPHSAAPTA